MEQKRKVGAHITKGQKTMLQTLLADQPLLRSGKFLQTFTNKDAAKAWQEIANKLNAVPGAKKDWKQWRKTWQDIFSKTKAKQALINKSRKQTGGGPPPPLLDEFEESVAALINPRSVSGHVESNESAVVFSYTQQYEEEHTSEPMMVYQILEEGMQESDPPNQSNTTVLPKRTKVNMKTLLKEKVEIKKKYYEEKLRIMKNQCEILQNISQSLTMLVSDSMTSPNII